MNYIIYILILSMCFTNKVQSQTKERINNFLSGNNLEILPNAGSISHDEAIEKAHAEYEVFRIRQDELYLSDLDKEIKKLNK